jgi:transposase
MDYFIGIDVSKKSLDLAVLSEGAILVEERIDNNTKSVKRFLKELLSSRKLSADQVTVCMEHTGIYNAHALEVFWKKGIRICMESAMRIKHSQGLQRGKTDKIDALRIAQYAFKNRQDLVFWKPHRLTIQKIQALLTMRERLIRTKVQLETPLKESVDFLDDSIVKDLAGHNRRVVRAIKNEIKAVDTQLGELIKQDHSVSAQMKSATSVTGVGPITALNMIITTGEFQRIREPRKYACYSGIAPFEHRSGSSIRGKTRVSKMANMSVKRLLHMAAMAAIKHNPELKAFYERKTAEGKNKMSVINAVRNKLISRVFACVNAGRTYQKNYANALA